MPPWIGHWRSAFTDRATRLFSKEKTTEWRKEVGAVADLGFHSGREGLKILFCWKTKKFFKNQNLLITLIKIIVYSATRSGSKRFRVARFTARDEVECCKRNDESLILPRSSRGSNFPQYTNDRK